MKKECECDICGFIVMDCPPEVCTECGGDLFSEKEIESFIECNKCRFVYDPENDIYELKEKFKKLNTSEWMCPVCHPEVLI